MLPDGTDITDGITAATVLGLIVALVRLALGAHDKRATVAESRETICVENLKTTTAAITGLTTEVHASNDGMADRLGNIERGVSELLEHARER